MRFKNLKYIDVEVIDKKSEEYEVEIGARINKDILLKDDFGDTSGYIIYSVQNGNEKKADVFIYDNFNGELIETTKKESDYVKEFLKDYRKVIMEEIKC